MPAHVQAGIDAALALGMEVEIGPLSNTMRGEAEDLLRALHAAERAAVSAGATRIVINLEAEERPAGDHEFARALSEALGPQYRISLLDANGEVQATFGSVTGERVSRARLPLARSSGALLVELDLGAADQADPMLDALASSPQGTDAPVGSFTHVDRALAELISLAERRIGRPLVEMSRAEKQQVVRFLDERGAFALRKSVEMVADALGVSRFTVYNYLDSTRQAGEPGAGP